MAVIDCRVVPKGSYVVRVWLEGEYLDPYDTVLILSPLDDETIEVGSTIGTLNDEVNILVGLKCMELGYKYLRFNVVKGQKVTRHAKYAYSDKSFDYYVADLHYVAQELMNDQKASDTSDAR